jgi:hypothetical protein
MDLINFEPFLHQKCVTRNVTFCTPADFFSTAMIQHVERTWNQWLSPLVPGLPAFDAVLRDLKPQIAALLASADA